MAIGFLSFNFQENKNHSILKEKKNNLEIIFQSWIMSFDSQYKEIKFNQNCQTAN